MRYTVTSNGVFDRIVYGHIPVVWDDTHYCEPDRLTEEEKILFGIAPLVETAIPAYNPLLENIVEGVPVLTNEEWYQVWDVVALNGIEQAARFSEATASRWELIKAERDTRKDGGTLVNGKWFHSDRDSRIQQIGLVLMGASVPAVQWKTMDKTFITMSQALAGGIFQATAVLDMQLFEVAEGHRLAMEASERPDLYDFSAGWPDKYSE